MTIKCPKGHDSTDSDYCSECGARMGAGSGIVPAQTAAAASTSGNACPDCGTPRTGNMRFCEVCRYDFQNRTATATPAASPVLTEIPASPPPLSEKPLPEPEPVPPPIAAPLSAASKLSQRVYVAVITDPSLVTEPDPANPCPVGAPERIFPLDLEENMVGRRSDSKGVFPEVEVADPGVSHRHLKFMRMADGSFAALELGSTNGTTLRDKPLEPGVLTPMNPGDQLLIGMWTRLEIRTR